MDDARGRIATFYSYKGGTGRSMALANFAWIMAASGQKVLAIDWDLEAPGLHRYFRPFMADPDLFETDGLIDAFWNLAANAAQRRKSASTVPAKPGPIRSGITGPLRKSTAKETLDAEANGDPVVEALQDATRRLASKFFPKDERTGNLLGYIDFIGAGRQGGTYSERVNSFDWKRFYDLGGAEVLSEIKTYLRKRYDWVLIDSRTGVSDTSGICTIQMPETVVAFFTLNRQSIDGVTAILRSIREFRSSSVDGSTIEFFPIATRIENAEQARLEVARRYARAALADFLPKDMQFHPRAYWDKMEISYRPSYAFEEVLAAFGDPTGAAGAKDTMLSQVEATAQQISGDDDLRMPEIVEKDRDDILKKYYFGASSKETENGEDIDFPRQVRAKEQLWRTYKFDWRLLLSRSELDKITPEDLKGFGRNMSFYHKQSERMHRLLRIGQIVGTGSFTLVLVLIAAFIFSPLLAFDPLSSPRAVILTIIYAVMSGWVVSVLARSIVTAVLDKPQGFRLVSLLTLALYGPFGPQIANYNADRRLM